jgi:hypothetical protein
MKQSFDYFEYKLPDMTAEYYANKAIDVLKQIQSKFPDQFKRNFRSPSEVLTLSGVRAFDTYYDLGQNFDAESIQELKKLLGKHGILLILETMDFADETNKTNRYSLLNIQGFENIKKQYGNIPSWIPLHFDKLQRDVDFMTWWWAWQNNIAMEATRDNDKLIQKWLKIDWYAPLNITFGMLLGYPGEAICSILWDDVSQNAIVKKADKFNGAQPVYDYSKKLVKNKNIQNHTKLWSDILTLVYDDLKI